MHGTAMHGTAMGRERVRRLVLDALREVAPEAHAAQLDPEASFRDQLGLDSIDFLNFVLRLGERAGVRVPESDHPKLATLSGCIAYFARPRRAPRATRRPPARR
jgi:acyl carrier protein